MAENIESLRNIAFASHGGAGKTSLAETMLFNSGVIKRIGRVEDGNTIMDFEPEELKRNISLSSGFHQFNWKKHTISVIDTPGDQNFLSDTKSCMQAADSAVIVVDAVDGVKVQTEQAWGFAEEFQLPCIIFINKLDRERANFMRAFKDAVECFEPKPMIMQIPIGSEANFSGIVDLVGMKAYTFDTKGKATKIDIPSDMQDMVSEERETLVENVVESDDELLERYLEGESLSDDEIKGALKKGILSRSFAPVLCGSVAKNIGIELLQDFIVQCMPSPLDRGSWIAADATGDGEIECRPDPNAPFSGFVFKTVADPFAGRLSIFRIVSGTLGADGSFFNVNKDTNERYNQLLRLAGKEQKQITKAGPGAIVAVAKLKETTTGDTICNSSQKVKFKCADPLPPLISFAVNAKSKGDEDKVFTSLSKLLEEDMSLQLTRNPETKQILLSGLGQVHIEVTTERLKRKFNVEVQLDKPKVPYKETITKKVRVQGKHKKQTGGHGQYGDCWIQIEPLPRGKGFEFENKIVGGVIPRQYIPAVEKGVIESAQKGVLAGFPCVDFKAILDYGSYHAVDSSEMAFKIAGSLAFKKAATDANPVLLEPIMNVSVITPDEYMGDIMGDLNSRRGRVIGMDSKGKNQVIKAQVPMSEFLSYAPDLNSITGGRGIFTMEFSHYDEVPAQISQKIIEEINKAKE
ncbi:MAG: elongation factor G [Deltaproteobacteria bacterium]|jgi:elongation factor G|nr:elongation factor G [Deltaproteobacteria bacterium]